MADREIGGSRRLAIRCAMVALWMVLGALLFILNRGHTLIIDNRSADGLDAPERVTVLIDGRPSLEFVRGERDLITVKAAKHRLRLQFADGAPPYSGTFTLPIKEDMYLLSIPKTIADRQPFIEVFHIAPEAGGEEDVPELFGN